MRGGDGGGGALTLLNRRRRQSPGESKDFYFTGCGQGRELMYI